MPDRLGVPGCAGVGEADQIGGSDLVDEPEGLAVREQVMSPRTTVSSLPSSIARTNVDEPSSLAATGRRVVFAGRVTHTVELEHEHWALRSASRTLVHHRRGSPYG